MSEMTYPRDSEDAVPAKKSKCDNCGEYKLITMVSNWGKFCDKCAEDFWKEWNEPRGKARDSLNKGFDEPFTLEPDI